MSVSWTSSGSSEETPQFWLFSSWADKEDHRKCGLSPWSPWPENSDQDSDEPSLTCLFWVCVLSQGIRTRIYAVLPVWSAGGHFSSVMADGDCLLDGI